MTDFGPELARAVKLLMKHHATLQGYIFACLRDYHASEDVLQEVSVVVLQSFSQLTDEKGFLPWAREIARRCLLAYVRKADREKSYDPELVELLADAAARVEAVHSPLDRYNALLGCLEQLSPASRRLLRLRYDGSLGSIGEVANQVGLTVQAVYAQIKRAKAVLRTCVERKLTLENQD